MHHDKSSSFPVIMTSSVMKMMCFQLPRILPPKDDARDVGNDVNNHLHHVVATIASAAARKLLQLAPSETMLCHMTSLPNELLEGLLEDDCVYCAGHCLALWRGTDFGSYGKRNMLKQRTFHRLRTIIVRECQRQTLPSQFGKGV